MVVMDSRLVMVTDKGYLLSYNLQNIRVWYKFTYTGCFLMRCRNPSRIMENIFTGRVIYKVLSGMDGVSIVSYGIQCLRVLLEDQDNPLYKRDPLGCKASNIITYTPTTVYEAGAYAAKSPGDFVESIYSHCITWFLHINPI